MKPLHLAALWAFAFVQPLLDLLGREPQFFVARGNTGADIVLYALAFTVVPPALMALAVWLAGRVRPALGEALMLVLVAALVAAILLPPAGDLLGGSAASVAVALLVGAGAALLYARAAAVQTFLTVLSPAPLLFLVLFLAVSPASELVLPGAQARGAAGAVESEIPVVMVVLDELPTTSLLDARDRIDARRYPAIASLARDATWYRDATTVAGRTTEAVPALLTGRRPREGDLPIAADHPTSLFTLLARSHRLAVEEPITDVCPPDLCSEERPGIGRRLRTLFADLRVVSSHLLLPEDLRGGLPPIDRDYEGFAGEGTVAPGATFEQRRAFIDEVFRRLGEDDPRERFARITRAAGRRGSRPPFLFLHTSLPHVPWRFLPDGRQYAVPAPSIPGLVEGAWTGPQWQVDQAYARHLLQAQYADRLLGGLLERLRTTGIYDRALVVLVADHGVSFRAGDRRRTPTPTNLHDVASIPLLIKTPGQEAGSVRRGAVRTIDVLPTIARELGIRLGDVDGVPAGERGADPSATIDMPDSWEGGTTQSFATVARQRAERRRRERALLAAAGYDPYAIGPRPELVGTRAVARGASAGHVRLVAGGGPWVSGRVTGVPEGAELAVAVNGRVAATTGVARRGRFGVLVPPQAGATSIAVLEIGPGGELRTL